MDKFENLISNCGRARLFSGQKYSRQKLFVTSMKKITRVRRWRKYRDYSFPRKRDTHTYLCADTTRRQASGYCNRDISIARCGHPGYATACHTQRVINLTHCVGRENR